MHLSRHHHRLYAAPPLDRPSAPLPRRSTFYPEDIQGGVTGNLPFNNQIRKLTDPLNANGAGH